MSEKESEYFNFVSRIQLVTSHSRSDTYYAYKNGKNDNVLYFVKGPFKDMSPINNFLTIQQYKNSINIPYIDAECIYLYPDMWKTGTPIGLRNHLNRNIKYPFLVCKSLIGLESIVFRIHYSKLWPKTHVIDPIKTILHLTKNILYKEMNNVKINSILVQYYNLIAIRIKFGCSDLADRNFIINDDILYSIDEEIISKQMTKEDVLNELKINRYEFIKSNLQKYIPYVKDELKEYLFSVF